MTPGLDDSTAPIADECQSFLDNVVAQFERRRPWNDRPGAVRANEVLDPETAGEDPDLLLTLASIQAARRDRDAIRSTLTRLITLAADRAEDVLRLAGEAGRAGAPEFAFTCSEVVIDDAVLRGEWDRAIDVLQSFLVHGSYVPALLKLEPQ